MFSQAYDTLSFSFIAQGCYRIRTCVEKLEHGQQSFDDIARVYLQLYHSKLDDYELYRFFETKNFSEVVSRHFQHDSCFSFLKNLETRPLGSDDTTNDVKNDTYESLPSMFGFGTSYFGRRFPFFSALNVSTGRITARIEHSVQKTKPNVQMDTVDDYLEDILERGEPIVEPPRDGSLNFLPKLKKQQKNKLKSKMRDVSTQTEPVSNEIPQSSLMQRFLDGELVVPNNSATQSGFNELQNVEELSHEFHDAVSIFNGHQDQNERLNPMRNAVVIEPKYLEELTHKVRKTIPPWEHLIYHGEIPPEDLPVIAADEYQEDEQPESDDDEAFANEHEARFNRMYQALVAANNR